MADAAAVAGAPRAGRPVRVLLGLSEIAGYYGNLRRGFEELGIAATFVDLAPNPFQYGDGGRVHPVIRLTRRVIHARLRLPPSSRLHRLAWLAVEVALRAALLVWAAARFDVFIFGFGATFLHRPRAELALLRRLGKTIITVHHGSDSRPPFMDGSLMAIDRGRTTADCIRLTERAKRRITELDRDAHWVIENPLSSHFHERRCVSWFEIGVPHLDTDHQVDARNAEDPAEPVRVRIVHSPSHPEAKGSPEIRAAIDRLIARGHPIDFVEITGRPHADVLAALAACDFVVDQLYSDSPMAGFASEAAHFGKPAVVGGFASAAFAQFVARDAMPPTLYCHPDEIEQAIERLVVDRAYRLELGRRARQFVRSRWSPRQVAERFLRLIEGTAPAEWMFDPRDVRYVHGTGLTEPRARRIVSDVVALGGPKALHVGDKPELLRALGAFARSDEPLAAPRVGAVTSA